MRGAATALAPSLQHSACSLRLRESHNSPPNTDDRDKGLIQRPRPSALLTGLGPERLLSMASLPGGAPPSRELPVRVNCSPPEGSLSRTRSERSPSRHMPRVLERGPRHAVHLRMERAALSRTVCLQSSVSGCPRLFSRSLCTWYLWFRSDTGVGAVSAPPESMRSLSHQLPKIPDLAAPQALLGTPSAVAWSPSTPQPRAAGAPDLPRVPPVTLQRHVGAPLMWFSSKTQGLSCYSGSPTKSTTISNHRAFLFFKSCLIPFRISYVLFRALRIPSDDLKTFPAFVSHAPQLTLRDRTPPRGGSVAVSDLLTAAPCVLGASHLHARIERIFIWENPESGGAGRGTPPGHRCVCGQRDARVLSPRLGAGPRSVRAQACGLSLSELSACWSGPQPHCLCGPAQGPGVAARALGDGCPHEAWAAGRGGWSPVLCLCPRRLAAAAAPTRHGEVAVGVTRRQDLKWLPFPKPRALPAL